MTQHGGPSWYRAGRGRRTRRAKFEFAALPFNRAHQRFVLAGPAERSRLKQFSSSGEFARRLWSVCRSKGLVCDFGSRVRPRSLIDSFLCFVGYWDHLWSISPRYDCGGASSSLSQLIETGCGLDAAARSLARSIQVSPRASVLEFGMGTYPGNSTVIENGGVSGAGSIWLEMLRSTALVHAVRHVSSRRQHTSVRVPAALWWSFRHSEYKGCNIWRNVFRGMWRSA